MKKIIPFFAVIIMVAACQKSSAPAAVIDKSGTPALITDINDPGKYTSIKIGTQKWMTTNLAVSRYRNGDKIPEVKGKAAWTALTTGAWCWYNNDSATGAVYGKLYNWYAVNDPRGLAPTGWHVPSEAEWDTLSKYLGGHRLVGGKMKEAGTTHWLAPNTGATNSSGFTGLPGGSRTFIGTFYYIGMYGSFWSSSEYSTFDAYLRDLSYGNSRLTQHYYNKRNGFSVRCLGD